MDAIPLALQQRDVLGKKTKRLRARGITPVHLYGRGVESRSLQGPTGELIKVLARAGATAPLAITVEGERQPRLAFVREVQWDPIRGDLLHVDFLQVEVGRPIRSQVPVTTTGEAEAARAPGAMVMHHLHAIEVEALPMEIPREVVADLSLLDAPDKVIRVRDLEVPPGVTVLTAPDELVAAVALARAGVEEEAPAAEKAEEAKAEAEEQGKKEEES